MRMRELQLQEDELFSLCEILQENVAKSPIVLLRGELGSGKTTLVRSFVAYCGGDTSEVSSPTFSLSQGYECQKYGVIYHYDIYRKELSEMLELGLLECLELQGVHFVEWGGNDLQTLLRQNGFTPISIDIELGQNNRIYRIYKVGV